MDYKEKYEQALAKAKEQYNYPCMRSCMGILEEIFPELAESEDEKVRKAILDYLTIMWGNSQDDVCGVHVEDAIAWLEKQGMQIDIANKEYWRGYREGKKEILDKYAEIEKQGKQKPADKVEPKFKIGDKIYLKPEYRMPDDDTPIANTVFEIRAIDDKHYRFDGSYIFIEDQDKYELVEQKSAWSEEDEDNFKHLLDEIVCLGNNRNSANRLYYDRLIKFIEELKNRAQPKEKWCDKDERMLDRLIAYFEKQVAFTDDDNPRYANWLKSLKGRVQPKQEWSKEDEEFLRRAINAAKDVYPMTANWLKSLRPQNHWKPSDQQIRGLQAMVNDPNNASSESCQIVLKDILEKLKKLKEGKV